MNIGYISSNEYSPYLGVSMFSVLDSNRDADEINVYIFDVNISEDNKKKIKSIADKYNRKVIFVSENERMEKIVEDVGLTAFGGTSSTYVKIFPEIFFTDADRILMLDCDTIIKGSLSELYNTDLKEGYVAAVPEIAAYYRTSEDPNIIYKNRFYYNTGVLLWDLDKMRRDSFNDRLIKAFKRYKKPLHLADQSLLNLTVEDKDVTPVNMKYNYNNNLNLFLKDNRPRIMETYEYYGLGIPEADYYKLVPAKYVTVIHYIGVFRPWLKWANPTFKNYFFKYWNRSPWKRKKLDSYLDVEIKRRVEANPGSLAGRGIVGRIYVAMSVTIARYCPSLHKNLQILKSK